MVHEIIESSGNSEESCKLGAPMSALTSVSAFVYACGRPPIDLTTGEIIEGDICTQTRACV